MKNFLLLLAVIFLSFFAYGQVPQALTYQAVARNAAGNAIINSTISIRISIKDVTSTGPTLYSETHSVTTNQFGLFTIAIGTGLIQSGVFSTINWALGSKYMKVEMDATGGSAYIDMGTSQLLSVPYALVAGSVINTSAGDDWGAQTAITNPTIGGNGTTASPLGIAQQGASSGQTLKWNGSQWVPANDMVGAGGDNWGTQIVITNSTLSGAGTSASPLGMAQQGATTGQTLKWNGAAWAPANDIDNDAQTISLVGSNLSISNGNSVTLPSPINYAAGVGINIAGNVITNTGDVSNTNELQTLSVSGNQLTISNGNTVAINTGTNYTAGTGIDVTGTVITNTSPDQIVSITGTGSASVFGTYPNFTINATDDQQLSISGNQLTISNGNSVNIPVQTPYTAGAGIGIVGTTITNTSLNTDNQLLTIAGTTISISNGNSINLPVQTPYTAGTGIGIAGTVISNLNPDQIVTITGTGASTVTGTYPSFTINSIDTDTDAQTLSVSNDTLFISNGNNVVLPTGSNYSAGTGINITGNVITNASPDQVVTLSGTGMSTVTGTYPGFTISTVASTDATLTGNGTGGIPLRIAQQGATAGQVLKWNGASWLPANDIDIDAQTLSIAGNILSLTNGGSVTLPTGATYLAGSGINLTGTTFSNNAITDLTLTGNGTAGTPLKIAQQGATNGQTLKWNGIAWLPANDIDTDLDQQNLSIAGTTLTISNGNSVTLPAGTVYAAGSGINLTGTTFNNNAQTDATLTGNGTVATPLKIAQQGATNGQVLQWNGTTWVAATLTAGGTLGQVVNTVFGTSAIVINTTPVVWFLVPGLTQTINVPSGFTAFISTDGGVAGSGTLANQYSIVDIAIFIDGAYNAPGGGYKRLVAANTDFLTQMITNWDVSLTAPLAAGIHTIDVKAIYSGALGCTVSGDATSVLQGQLTVMLIKN